MEWSRLLDSWCSEEGLEMRQLREDKETRLKGKRDRKNPEKKADSLASKGSTSICSLIYLLVLKEVYEKHFRSVNVKPNKSFLLLTASSKRWKGPEIHSCLWPVDPCPLANA